MRPSYRVVCFGKHRVGLEPWGQLPSAPVDSGGCKARSNLPPACSDFVRICQGFSDLYERRGSGLWAKGPRANRSDRWRSVSKARRTAFAGKCHAWGAGRTGTFRGPEKGCHERDNPPICHEYPSCSIRFQSFHFVSLYKHAHNPARKPTISVLLNLQGRPFPRRKTVRIAERRYVYVAPQLTYGTAVSHLTMPITSTSLIADETGDPQNTDLGNSVSGCFTWLFGLFRLSSILF